MPGFFGFPVGFMAPPDSLVLDLYPSAIAAYSIKKLRSAYTGPCMKITRTSDSVEQDIGFTSAGLLDSAAINSFAPSGATVSIWYDQSGNGLNIGQASTSRQPVIITNSPYFTDSRSLSFDGASTFLEVSPGSLLANLPGLTIFSRILTADRTKLRQMITFVSSTSASVSRHTFLLGGNGTAGNISMGGRRLNADSFQSATAGSIPANNTVFNASGLLDFQGAIARAFINSTQAAILNPFQTSGNSDSSIPATLKIGALSTTTDFFSGQIKTVIIYPIAQSDSNRTSIDALL